MNICSSKDEIQTSAKYTYKQGIQEAKLLNTLLIR